MRSINVILCNKTAIKKAVSLLVRLCSILHSQSLVPPSVPAYHSTRLAASFVVATFIFLLKCAASAKASAFFQRKKNKPPLVNQAVAHARQPSTSRGTLPLIYLFCSVAAITLASFCFAARASPAATPSLRWLAVTADTATRSSKKSFLPLE
jgi:hypothetical protein